MSLRFATSEHCLSYIRGHMSTVHRLIGRQSVISAKWLICLRTALQGSWHSSSLHFTSEFIVTLWSHPGESHLRQGALWKNGINELTKISSIISSQIPILILIQTSLLVSCSAFRFWLGLTQCFRKISHQINCRQLHRKVLCFFISRQL